MGDSRKRIRGKTWVPWLATGVLMLLADVERLPKVVYDPAHTAGLEASAYRQVLEGLTNKYGKGHRRTGHDCMEVMANKNLKETL